MRLQVMLVSFTVTSFDKRFFKEALHLCIAIIDDYTSKVQIRKDRFQLIGVTALLLASKQLIYDAPEISTLLSLCEVS